MVKLLQYIGLVIITTSFACKTDDIRQIISESHDIKIDSAQIKSFAIRIQNRFSNYENDSMPNDSTDSHTEQEEINGRMDLNRMPYGAFILRIHESESVSIKLYTFDAKDSCVIYSGVLGEGFHKIYFSSLSLFPKGKYIIQHNDLRQEIFLDHK